MGAVGAAVAASACCTIPLALVTMGIGGAWVSTFTAMEPFRPFFISIAVVALAFAGLKEYRRARGPECDYSECDCDEGLSTPTRRSLLFAGLIVTIALVASPYLIRGAVDTAIAEAKTAGLNEVVLDVSGMTCAACDITVSRALTNLDGVEEAKVTFEPPQAVVKFDPEKVSVTDMEMATTNVGYPAKVKSD